jgi:enoyl-CoA hydratase/carnithine racemase
MVVVREVRVEVGGRVGVITIDRPHTRNAIGLATAAEFEAAIVEVSAASPAVVVIAGAGDRAFISGGDLKELEAVRSVDDAEHMARRMRSVLDALAALPVPVIAALNGHALGGGAEVAVAADIRIAADDVRIGFIQSSLGIMPAWGGAERLTRLVGRSQALLLMCTGRVLTSDAARGAGLVDAVLPRGEFDAGWRDIATRFAALPGSATRSIKATVTAVSPAVFPAADTDAVRAFAELWCAPEHWEMAAAALARRRHEGHGE